jgi:hypothetical protein
MAGGAGSSRRTGLRVRALAPAATAPRTARADVGAEKYVEAVWFIVIESMWLLLPVRFGRSCSGYVLP